MADNSSPVANDLEDGHKLADGVPLFLDDAPQPLDSKALVCECYDVTGKSSDTTDELSNDTDTTDTATDAIALLPRSLRLSRALLYRLGKGIDDECIPFTAVVTLVAGCCEVTEPLRYAAVHI